MAAKKKAKKSEQKTKSKKTSKRKSDKKKVVAKKQRSVSAGKENKSSKKKEVFWKSNKFLYILAAVLAVVAILYLLRGVFVAAVVNGQPISRLSIVKELEKSGGEQALDSLITRNLIAQEARERGITISEEVIQDEIDRITGIVEGQGTTLEEALNLRGQTLEDLRTTIRIQKQAEGLLGDDIKITDDEVMTYFEENQSLYGEDAEFAELEGNIREQLKQQKLQAEFQSLIEELRNDASIMYFVNY